MYSCDNMATDQTEMTTIVISKRVKARLDEIKANKNLSSMEDVIIMLLVQTHNIDV